MALAKNDSEDEKDFDRDKLEEEGLKVTFLCVVFVNESIVTGGDEGFVRIYQLNNQNYLF